MLLVFTKAITIEKQLHFLTRQFTKTMMLRKRAHLLSQAIIVALFNYFNREGDLINIIRGIARALFDTHSFVKDTGEALVNVIGACQRASIWTLLGCIPR